MLRIVAAALMLLTALPNAAVLCNAWCATHQTAERCQHTGAVDAALVTAAHDCNDSLAAGPGLNERTITSAPDASGLATSAVGAPPPAVWLALTQSGRPAEFLSHPPLRTPLRI